MITRAREERFDSMLTIRERRVRVRYRAGLAEDEWFRVEVARAHEAGQAGADHAEYRYRQLAAHAIEVWDLRDEDGRPVPVTEPALETLPIGGLQRIIREALQQGCRPDLEGSSDAGRETSAVQDAARVAMLAQLRAADEACYRAQADLVERDAMVARAEEDGSGDLPSSWHARRAELLRAAVEQAELVAVLYAAVYAPKNAPDLEETYAD